MRKQFYEGEHECVPVTNYFTIVVNGSKRKMAITTCSLCGVTIKADDKKDK